jgi:ABC-2 type transport system permease protein
MAAVYKRDLRAYFTSPLGYVFIAAFLIVMNAVFFVTNMLTGRNSISSVYTVTLYILIIIVPVLTMRTFSEDYKQKTDQLLLTAPVKASGIVLGKFFAAYTVYFIALLFTIIYVIIVSAVGDVNMPSIIGNYIALLGVATVYISIGIFISSLTENQLVACIATLGIFIALFILDYAYGLVNVDWIKTVLYWLSIFRRYNTFFLGVFSVADFFYYISISAVFVFLTVRVLEKKRWS